MVAVADASSEPQASWIACQEKAFLRWANAQLEYLYADAVSRPRIVDLKADIARDSTLLLKLLEVVSMRMQQAVAAGRFQGRGRSGSSARPRSGSSAAGPPLGVGNTSGESLQAPSEARHIVYLPLGRWNRVPKNAMQHLENFRIATDYVNSLAEASNIRVSYKPEQLSRPCFGISDENFKFVLGLMWILIQLSYGLTSGYAVFHEWCARFGCVMFRPGFLKDSQQWKRGLSFISMMTAVDPLTQTAFDSDASRWSYVLHHASERFGVPKLLDVDDVLDEHLLDEKAFMAYLSGFKEGLDRHASARSVSLWLQVKLFGGLARSEISQAVAELQSATIRILTADDSLLPEAKADGLLFLSKFMLSRQRALLMSSYPSHLTSSLQQVESELLAAALSPADGAVHMDERVSAAAAADG